MKSLFIVCLALSVAAEVPIFKDYHRDIGIPLAARIKAAESAIDFDGSRIAGGSLSSEGENPHMGGLIITLPGGFQSACGSSLVSPTASVTAAHCWRLGTFQATLFTVVLGSIRLYSGGTRVNSNNVDVHPGYTESPLKHDIAMIIFPAVTLTDNIQPIPIATGSNTFAGSWATVVGHGITGTGTGISNEQRQVDVQVITNAVCAQTFGSQIVTENILCVGTTVGHSPCSSDSGGPLAIGSGSNGLLIGIVSFSAPGCAVGFPVGFERITYYASWISARM